jgi:hypothetical protein
MKRLVVLALLIMVGSAFAYHEFKVPKKAYKTVEINYYSNDDQITSPCSTVYLYYDKSDVEMYREVKKGCCNPLGGTDIGDSLAGDTWTIDIFTIDNTDLVVDSLIPDDNTHNLPAPGHPYWKGHR